MIVRSTKKFAKELKRCPREIQNEILLVLDEIELVDNLMSISNIKRLSGYNNFFRYKTGSWRLGLELQNNIVKICLVRTIGPRGDFYKHFPPK